MNGEDFLEAERVLGHPVDRNRRASIGDLNRVPVWLIDALHVLVTESGRLLAIRYLAYHCTDRFGLFAAFIEDVVEGTADVSTWRLDRPWAVARCIAQ